MTALSLGDNQLHGTIPPELGELSNLTALCLSGNQRTVDIPDSTSLPLCSLRLDGNEFVFADFEPEFIDYDDGAPAIFQYSPQATAEHAGEYSYTVRNTIATDLTLTSRTITLDVSACGAGVAGEPTELCDDGSPCSVDADCRSGICNVMASSPVCAAWLLSLLLFARRSRTS